MTPSHTVVTNLSWLLGPTVLIGCTWTNRVSGFDEEAAAVHGERQQLLHQALRHERYTTAGVGQI